MIEHSLHILPLFVVVLYFLLSLKPKPTLLKQTVPLFILLLVGFHPLAIHHVVTDHNHIAHAHECCMPTVSTAVVTQTFIPLFVVTETNEETQYKTPSSTPVKTVHNKSPPKVFS